MSSRDSIVDCLEAGKTDGCPGKQGENDYEEEEVEPSKYKG
jgi:hypothetical protein